MLHSGTRMRPILLFSLACAAAARVTEVDCSARFRECLGRAGRGAGPPGAAGRGPTSCAGRRRTAPRTRPTGLTGPDGVSPTGPDGSRTARRTGPVGGPRRPTPDGPRRGPPDGPDGIPDAMDRTGADTSSAAPDGRGAVLSLEPVLNQQLEFTHTLAPSRQRSPIRKLQVRLEVPLEGGPHGRADDERHAHAEDVVLRSFQF